MYVVSNGDLLLFERVIGDTCIDVELICCLCIGVDGGEIGEYNFFERDEDNDESLNDEWRLSLKDLADDDDDEGEDSWFSEDFLSKKELLSDVVLLLFLLNKLSLVYLFEEDVVGFVWIKSSSSSHIWLNKSDKTGNIRWQRLHVRNCSIPLDKLPVEKNKNNINNNHQLVLSIWIIKNKDRKNKYYSSSYIGYWQGKFC